MLSAPWQKPFRGMQLNKSHPLAKGLVGAYVMNEGTGDTIFDLSGNNNNGMISGADWVSNGLDFVAANNDYVNLGSASSLDDINPITICIWLKSFGFGDDDRIYTKDDTGGSGKTLCIREAPDNVLEYRSSYSITDGFWWSPTNSFLPNNQYFMCVTHDNSDVTNDPIIYIDGNSVLVYEERTPSGTIVSDAGIDAIIGNRPDAARPWNGPIDSVYIYNRILTPPQVAQLNREPFVMFQPTFSESLYYRLPTSPTLMQMMM